MSIQVMFLWKNETDFIPVMYLFDSMDSAEAYAEDREGKSRDILDVRIEVSDKPATHSFINGQTYNLRWGTPKLILGGAT